ncbi:hypothetical protein ACIGW7_37890 [Streptomyces sp. NPDC053253]|uniref:hypothetical protein n=1 Tax=Streptomyces sp. NPDC053253 TaxID=3365699 RepID=UPI0037D077AB
MNARVRDTTGAAAAGPAALPPAPRASGGLLEQARARFPSRAAGRRWPITNAPAGEVLAALELPPFRADTAHTRWHRRSGARAVLAWLSGFEGESWQERWEASPAAACPQRWRREAEAWVSIAAVRGTNIQAGLLMLAAADVIRLPLPWQRGLNSPHVRTLVEECRDPDGFARLKEVVGAERWTSTRGGLARRALTRIMLAKGGGLADITVGDALEYDAGLRVTAHGVGSGGTLYYAWLRDLGHLPPDAPTTLRFLEQVIGQLTCIQLVDRHPVASRGSEPCSSTTWRNAVPAWTTPPWTTSPGT